MAIRTEGNKTYANWGKFSTNPYFTVLNRSVLVEDDPIVECFDAVWYRNDRILVDCVNKTASKGLVNTFFYVDSERSSVVGTKQNTLFTNYTKISTRKLYYYGGSKDLIFRVYYSWAVDPKNKNSTYVEVISMIDQMNPQTLRVMDRQFFGLDSVSIVDFKLIGDTVYVVDESVGTMAFKINEILRVNQDGKNIQ